MRKIWNRLSAESRKELAEVALMIALLAPFIVTGLAAYAAGQYAGITGAVLVTIQVATLIIMIILEVILWKMCS